LGKAYTYLRNGSMLLESAGDGAGLRVQWAREEHDLLGSSLGSLCIASYFIGHLCVLCGGSAADVG